MKANKDLVENTKTAVKTTLETLIELSGSYIDHLAERFPEKFQTSDTNRTIIPFPLIEGLSQLLSQKFDLFKETTIKKVDPKYNN
jgi:hypothetical protein